MSEVRGGGKREKYITMHASFSSFTEVGDMYEDHLVSVVIDLDGKYAARVRLRWMCLGEGRGGGIVL